MKTCERCQVSRPEDSFYRHAVVCKICIGKTLALAKSKTRKKRKYPVVYGACCKCEAGPNVHLYPGDQCSLCYQIYLGKRTASKPRQDSAIAAKSIPEPVAIVQADLDQEENPPTLPSPENGSKAMGEFTHPESNPDLCPWKGHRIKAHCGRDIGPELLGPLMNPFG